MDLAALAAVPRLATVRRASLVLLLAAMAACRGEAPSGAGATGGTLIVATPGDADNLLPPVMTTQLGAHVAKQIFPDLAEITSELNTTGDSGFVPSVARRWERRDSLTLVFHLDRRARWRDGPPITAADVAFTFAVYTDTLTASPFRVLLASIRSVEAQDESTAVFRFRRSYGEQLYDAVYQMRLLPKHLLDSIPRERLASSAFAREPVGAGPYHFVSWQPGSEITVEADSTWFLGRPGLRRIVWRVMPDVSSAVEALLAGEADAMETIPLKDDVERVRRDTALRLVPYPSPFVGGVLFNLRRPLFADRAVRRAIAMAVDRATVVAALFGADGDVPMGDVSPMMWIAAQHDIRQLPYDTALAARTLDSLGWRRAPGRPFRSRAGVSLSFTALVPTTSRIRQQAAVLVQSQLQRVGVEMRIQPLEFAVFQSRMNAGQFDATFFSRTEDPSPSGLAQFWGSAAVGGDNAGAYRSPAFDSLFALAAAARTRAEARPRWRAALEQLNDDAPAIFLYSPRNNAAVHRRFAGVTIRPDSWLADVDRWSVPPDRRLPRDR